MYNEYYVKKTFYSCVKEKLCHGTVQNLMLQFDSNKTVVQPVETYHSTV